MIAVGLDTAREQHRFVVVEVRTRKVLERGILPNATWAFEGWTQHLEDTYGSDILVGVETRGGFFAPLEQVLEGRGWKILQLTPEGVKTYREQVLRVQNKTDDTDALAAALLTAERAGSSRQAFVPRRTLRAATRFYEMLTRDHTRKVNALRKTMAAYWPEATEEVFYRMDLEYVVLLFERYPDPASIAAKGVDGMRRFFRQHGSNVCETTIQKIVRAAEMNGINPEEKALLLYQAKKLAAQLRRVTEDREDLERMIEKLAKGDVQVQQIAAPKGIGIVPAATFMAELQDVRNYPSEAHGASYAGLALARVQTGKSRNGRRVQWRANRHLKRCMYIIADGMRQNDQRSVRYYDKKRAEGKTHRQVLRCLGRQIFRVLFTMLRTGRVYEFQPLEHPRRRKAVQRVSPSPEQT